jgi:hypothetical protein
MLNFPQKTESALLQVIQKIVQLQFLQVRFFLAPSNAIYTVAQRRNLTRAVIRDV